MGIERLQSTPERKEDMPITMQFEWPTGVQKKLENGVLSEDFAISNEEQGFFIVADGVTRDVYERQGYSLARSAAEEASSALAEKFASGNLAMEEGFAAANGAVQMLNEKEGLWGEGNHNYLDRDLAGTCLAAVCRGDNEFRYGYVGDCRVVHISSDGKFFMTPDQVTEARAEFPKEGTREERAVTIRKERRNNPSDSHKTYGVLTGEDAALHSKYLNLGSISYQTGDVLAVCSDGVAPFIENDEQFRELLLHGDREEIQAFVANPESPHQNTDEKTLILYRA